MFEEISESSGILFENNLSYTEEFNPYTYRNFFNGAGVALGDINNDGLLDIYFTGNISDNKLFLNKGNWSFIDITEKAGVACGGVWSSGATFADINGDGYLDLYVCKSGKPEGVNRHNELFINNRDLTFTEKSKEYGLDVVGLSIHAAFFDYDKDGDLDCYLLTNSIRSVGGYDLIENQREIADPDGGGNKFFKNDGKFVDVTIDHGIYTSNIGFGLGITLSDFNNDGWTDIYISNDFFERDYLYLNNQGKDFTESLESFFKSISMGSMGADAADLDNDNHTDLFVTEMLPGSIERKRTKAIFESWDKYQLNVERGYFHQFPRNVLQRNTGDSMFLEIGRFSEVSATDWSWGALIFDMDNDGLKDIFISNGIYKDLLDRDYLTYMANEQVIKTILKEKGTVIKELIDIMPSSAVSNQVYKNKGDFIFENATENWGLKKASFSNGSAYGDLDNDGDLDLVVNNVNMPSFTFRNNSDTSTNRSIRIKFKGVAKNTNGIGAKVYAYKDETTFMVENFPSRGFQSSVDPVVHLGLGAIKVLDSVRIVWAKGTISSYYQVLTNRLIVAEEKNASRNKITRSTSATKILRKSKISIPYKHVENRFVDFDRDRLLPHMYHNEGPALAVGDIDGDGYDDIFLGSAKGFESKIFQYTPKGYFKELDNNVLAEDQLSEDVDAVFFDCDNDGDLDLYVASGGREFSKSSDALNDRLYINDGKGHFTKENNRLSISLFFSTSVVKNFDFDEDGDEDLFIAERFHPFYYGAEVRGYLLQNDGKGYFAYVTSSIAPCLMKLNMITDAVWADVDNDGRTDLILSTEWGPIKIFLNQSDGFVDITAESGIDVDKGWWNSIDAADIDGDGDIDLIAGNHGRNSFFRDSTRLYVKDFDRNGTRDYIFCEQIRGRYFPIADRDELVMQIPKLKKQLLYFKDYAHMAVNDIFTDAELSNALILDATILESSVFLNNSGQFQRKSLNPELQYGPIYSIETTDINQDGIDDILFGGNQYLVKPQFGRYDALPFSLLLSSKISGKEVLHQFPTLTQVRNIKTITINEKLYIILANNNAEVEVYEKSR
ncbi:MAG: CRTAC1 family protein [Bacteroidetes bacterium]|nr:CRTAC1 family protein [Bacteroidota bacterium]